MSTRIRATDLYDALQRHRLSVVSDTAELAVLRRYWDRIRQHLLSANKFIVDDEIEPDNEDVLASAAGMVEMDLFHLPLPTCYFENTAVLIIGEKREQKPYIFTTVAVEDGDHISLHPFFLIDRSWFDIGRMVHLDLRQTDLFGAAQYVDLYPKDKEHEFHQFLDHICEAAVYQVVGTIVLINSDGIRLQRFEEPRFINRQRLRKGKAPLFAHVMVHLHSALRREESGGELRRSPRLHLRRGHIRYRDDPTRRRWVRPHLVGRAKEGIVAHDYRVKT